MQESEQHLELIRRDPFSRAMLVSYENITGSAAGRSASGYGCGYGWGSYPFSYHRRRVMAYDPDQERIEFVSRVFNQKNIHFTSEEACPSEKYYDLTCLFMVLHNIRDCEDILVHLPGYLNPGGMTMFSYKSTYRAFVPVLDQWACDCGFTLAHPSQSCLSNEEPVEERCYYKNRDEEWLYVL